MARYLVGVLRCGFLTAAIVFAASCSSPQATVSVRQTIEPKTELPKELTRIAVFPVTDEDLAANKGATALPSARTGSQTVNVHVQAIASLVEVRQYQAGHTIKNDYVEPIPDLSNTLAARVKAILGNEIQAKGLELVIVDRDNVEKRMRERAIAAADLVEPSAAIQHSKELGIDGWIHVRASGAKRVLHGEHEAASVNTYATIIQNVTDRDHPQRSVRTETFQSVGRGMAIQGSITMTGLDGKTIHTESINESAWDESKPHPLLGSSKSESDLPPEAPKIDRMLTNAARKFVGAIVGVEVDPLGVELRASSNADCKQGVSLVRIGEWGEALAAFERAIAADPNDHRAQFGAGLAAEQLGRTQDAYAFFRKAYAIKPDRQYEDAVRRVRDKGGAS